MIITLCESPAEPRQSLRKVILGDPPHFFMTTYLFLGFYLRFILFMVQNYFINISCLTSPVAGFQSLQSFVFPGLQLNSLDRMTILTPWGQREAPCP